MARTHSQPGITTRSELPGTPRRRGGLHDALAVVERAEREHAVLVEPLDRRHEGVAAGGEHSCGVGTTGAVRCWGANGQGPLGYGIRSSPAPVVSPGSSAKVEMNDSPTLALTARFTDSVVFAGPGALREAGQVLAAPAVRRMARDMGVDLSRVPAGGNGTTQPG